MATTDDNIVDGPCRVRIAVHTEEKLILLDFSSLSEAIFIDPDDADKIAAGLIVAAKEARKLLNQPH